MCQKEPFPHDVRCLSPRRENSKKKIRKYGLSPSTRKGRLFGESGSPSRQPALLPHRPSGGVRYRRYELPYLPGFPYMTAAPGLSVTARAPVNIALVKYWGKRNTKLLLPLNGSLSVTLDVSDLCSTTTVMLVGTLTHRALPSLDVARCWGSMLQRRKQATKCG